MVRRLVQLEHIDVVLIFRGHDPHDAPLLREIVIRVCSLCFGGLLCSTSLDTSTAVFGRLFMLIQRGLLLRHLVGAGSVLVCWFARFSLKRVGDLETEQVILGLFLHFSVIKRCNGLRWSFERVLLQDGLLHCKAFLIHAVFGRLMLVALVFM